MAELPIPLEALEDCGAILGRRGAGKSATRTLFLEHELDRGRRCCLIDPKGDSWGIRLNPDRTPSRFQEVAIFGGAHGDLQLTDTMGPVLGRLVATHKLSCIVDLSAFSVAGMRRFMRDFAEALFENNRAALTLFLDEADQLAPQRLPADMAWLLHHMESLIRQGRQRGIFMWMLTQRPQVLNKNLLSQAESLVAMKMTTPHDRKAVREWMEAHDPELAKEVMDTLAQLAVGEAWTWVPSADFLERVRFPLFSTFDSMRAPRHGERVDRVELPPIDMTAIAAALAEVAPASDAPAAGKLAAEQRTVGGDRVAALLHEKDARIRELEEDREQLTAGVARLLELVSRRGQAIRSIGALVDRHVDEIDSPDLDLEEPRPPAEAPTQTAGGQRGGTPRSSRHVGGGEARPLGKAMGPGNVSPNPPPGAADPNVVRGRKALAALARIYPTRLSEAQWASLAGYARTGGTWGTYKSALRSAGLVEQLADGDWIATRAGVSAAGVAIEPLPAPGPELARFWGMRIPGGRRIVELLIKRSPHFTTLKGLASDLGMAAGGGTFGTYVSRLRANGLLEEHGRGENKKVRLAPAIMGLTP